MNERIRELALDAGYLPDMFGIGHWDMPECKKLAELIVRECVWQVVKDDKVPQDIQVLIGERFKQHFGVEE